MMIHEITSKAGKYKARKRVGRGPGSGVGKTSGRGHKGAGSRAGNSRRAYFEGGQMTWTRRLPKRGFTNANFRQDYHVVNVALIDARLDDGADVNIQVLADLGIVRDAKLPLKVLGNGDCTKKFNITAAKCSESARAKIEGAGGTVTLAPVKKWVRDNSKKKAKAAPVAESTDATEETKDS
ncbi:MAG TPA: 50S ribosomal protein L15 [Phycisphaerales bacterium]|nr:50S ribosomal protein L15 [Phycisphaerales bacterium]